MSLNVDGVGSKELRFEQSLRLLITADIHQQRTILQLGHFLDAAVKVPFISSHQEYGEMHFICGF
jgi:hypothetical protein